jgi:hypothetical protein
MAFIELVRRQKVVKIRGALGDSPLPRWQIYTD